MKIPLKYMLVLSVSAVLFLPETLHAADLFSWTDENMVAIEGGRTILGSPEDEAWREPDETRHTVSVSPFLISRYEVSQSEYELVSGSNPSFFRGGNLPVESLTWYEAVVFCNALSQQEGLEPAYVINGESVVWNRDASGFRLPTEAEWEHACRAGSSTPFSTGPFISASESNYFGTYPYTIEDHYFSQDELETAPGVYREKTVPVDSFAPNDFGLYNMHGNVSEWCFDYYGSYSATSADPSGPESGYLRVCRGGAWNDFAKHLRSAYRSAVPPDDRLPGRGFRLVRNVK